MATNQLQYLPYANQIIFLKGGKIVDSGKFDDLRARCKEFRTLTAESGFEKETVERKRRGTIIPEPIKSPRKSVRPTKTNNIAKLVKAEEKRSGLVSQSIYNYYFKAGGVALFGFIIALFAFSTGGRILYAKIFSIIILLLPHFN